VRLGNDDIAVSDFGGVVARFVPQRREARPIEATGFTATELEQRFFRSGLDHDAERGVYKAVDIVGVLIEALDCRLDAARDCGWRTELVTRPNQLLM
jgi:hypothetical protein